MSTSTWGALYLLSAYIGLGLSITLYRMARTRYTYFHAQGIPWIYPALILYDIVHVFTVSIALISGHHPEKWAWNASFGFLMDGLLAGILWYFRKR